MNQSFKHKALNDSSVLVVGLVRNCSKSIVKDVERLRMALNSSNKLQWLLVESDSTDSSLDMLSQLKNTIAGFNYCALGILREKFPLRTDRIAQCRNIYVEEIRNNSKYKDVDYVVVSDFDDINTDISQAAIESCWINKDWDICSANQNGPYYDVWALRHAYWSPNDCWSQYKFLQNFISDSDENLRLSVYGRMIFIDPSSQWIEVDSAFGGLAICRKEVFQHSLYVGLTNLGEEICEHVMFCNSLIQKGYKIFINPRLVNAGYTEHTRQLLLTSKVKKNYLTYKNRLANYMRSFIK